MQCQMIADANNPRLKRCARGCGRSRLTDRPADRITLCDCPKAPDFVVVEMENGLAGRVVSADCLADLPCVHRSNVREVEVPACCGGTAAIEVGDCAVYGACAIVAHGPYRSCIGCSGRTAGAD